MRRSWLAPLAIASLLIGCALATDRSQQDEQAIRKAETDFETARAAKSKRGRPKGSKNAPKVSATQPLTAVASA